MYYFIIYFSNILFFIFWEALKNISLLMEVAALKMLRTVELHVYRL